MKLKDIVCDFELAEKLDKLGVKCKSLFYWHVCNKKGIVKASSNTPQSPKHGVTYHSTIVYSAYTVAELGGMLPSAIKSKNSSTHVINSYKLSVNDKHVSYLKHICSEIGDFDSVIDDIKEANMKAKRLIWCIENNHVNVEELNNG